MSWQDEMAALMRKGIKHEPSATETFVAFARSRDPHITLDQTVEELPPICRGQARRILRDARNVGETNTTICKTIVATYAQERDVVPTQLRNVSNDMEQFYGVGNPF